MGRGKKSLPNVTPDRSHDYEGDRKRRAVTTNGMGGLKKEDKKCAGRGYHMFDKVIGAHCGVRDEGSYASRWSTGSD